MQAFYNEYIYNEQIYCVSKFIEIYLLTKIQGWIFLIVPKYFIGERFPFMNDWVGREFRKVFVILFGKSFILYSPLQKYGKLIIKLLHNSAKLFVSNVVRKQCSKNVPESVQKSRKIFLVYLFFKKLLNYFFWNVFLPRDANLIQQQFLVGINMTNN